MFEQRPVVPVKEAKVIDLSHKVGSMRNTYLLLKGIDSLHNKCFCFEVIFAPKKHKEILNFLIKERLIR